MEEKMEDFFDDRIVTLDFYGETGGRVGGEDKGKKKLM